MAKQTCYLIVRADRSVRVVRKLQRGLANDEIAIPLVLTFPENWGKIQRGQETEITVPDFTPTLDPPTGPEVGQVD